MTLTYTGGNGSQKYTVNYSPVTISTNFNCNGIADYSQHQVDLVSSIVLPANGGSYTFGYDAEGRINSMTLPTGGVISYAYSGVRCADATATSVTRTVTLGSNHSTWTYSSDSNAQGSGTTTITDPGQNQTTVKFQFYTPILRKIYQGSATGTPLEQITWCYNNVAQSCSTPSGLGLGSPALPALTVLRSLNGGSSNMTVTYYGLHPLWLPTEVDSYDFGASSPMRKVITAYGNYASGTTCNPFTGNIIDRICYTDVEDGNGTLFAQSTDQYDSKGNLTTLGNWTGSTTLNTIYTYYSNGALKTVQDPNGATTTYSSLTCGGGAFPQTISEPLTLSRSMTWDCDGGVVKSITDENGEPTTYDHTDEFWRTTAVTNQGYPATNFSYPDANDFESSMIFNNSTSTVDITTTIDGVGRPILRQKANDPNKDGFDSVGYQYGWNTTGAFFKQSLPYSGSPVAWTTTQYDALGRPSTVTDGGSGTVTYIYTGNDVRQTISSPSLQKQFEYDSLGRLTSICEITGVSGSGPCGQNQAATGYLTKYTYNALGNLRTVTQNAQPGEIGGTQTRTYYYDALSRLTKEINPENGTTQYSWDVTATNCAGGYSTPGDLGSRVDQAGNYTCYGYDALHRLQGFSHATGHSCTSYVYDAAQAGWPPPSGSNPLNTKGRIIEAYTNSNCDGQTSIVADKWLSYSPRGEVTDIYMDTPNSNGYYHIAKQYWANGVMSQLSGLPGVPTISYGVDGEGRWNTVSAASGQNPVTQTTYNPARQVTSVIPAPFSIWQAAVESQKRKIS